MDNKNFKHPVAATYDMFAQQRQQLNDEINGFKRGHNFVPKTEVISFERFKKNDAEKLQLKEAKMQHKQALLKLGLDPKKVMNVPFSK